jgi:hypothetical protein
VLCVSLRIEPTTLPKNPTFSFPLRLVPDKLYYGLGQKRQQMKKHSLLPINQTLLEMPVWDVTTILRRGEELFDRALHI